MAVVEETIFTNQASLDKASEIVKDRMSVDEQEYINNLDIRNHSSKIILDNNFLKINKKFETAYIDSETYQENTITETGTILPTKITAIGDEGTKQVNDINAKIVSVKGSMDTATNSKKTALTTLINNATNGVATANNPVAYKNGNEIILHNEVVKSGMVYLTIPDTAHFANYKSHGISFDSKTHGRVEPHGITTVDGKNGLGTMDNESKYLYAQILKNEGLYFGQRLNPSSEYLSNISYPNVKDVKSIMFTMDKPGRYDKDLVLYDGEDYNISLKFPYAELFTKDFDNIVIVNTVQNKLWINDVLIAADRYFNKMLLPSLPKHIFDSSLRVNESDMFKKEDLIEIFGKKPVGYDTVVMNPIDGVFSNPEGTCQGQLVLEEEKVLVAKANLFKKEDDGRIIAYDSGSALDINYIGKQGDWHIAIINGVDAYGSTLRFGGWQSKYIGYRATMMVDIEIENYPSEPLYINTRIDNGDATLIERDIPNSLRTTSYKTMSDQTNVPQLIIGRHRNSGSPIIYNNTKIKWKNVKYTIDENDYTYTDSREDVYEIKRVKKLWYGNSTKIAKYKINPRFTPNNMLDIAVLKLDFDTFKITINGTVSKTENYYRILLCDIAAGGFTTHFSSIEVLDSSRDFKIYNAYGGGMNTVSPGYPNDHQTFIKDEHVYYIAYRRYSQTSPIEISIFVRDGDVYKDDYIIFRRPYIAVDTIDTRPYSTSDVPETIISFD